MNTEPKKRLSTLDDDPVAGWDSRPSNSADYFAVLKAHQEMRRHKGRAAVIATEKAAELEASKASDASAESKAQN